MIERDTLGMQAAYEDGDDETDIIPAGYFDDKKHDCCVGIQGEWVRNG